ncbi:glycine cleavage system aminomethyltransferase GcvT [Dietzia sp.]|uniref:glycine cleavage system aminomethyltransferase GcvT n=1 Tax=Dietzia sp. TaxID=1871616 RepID=UPI002FD9E489
MAGDDTGDLRRGPVHAEHERAGATFAPFGGWSMPVSYEGTVSEHNATRNAVGLFDVSHLGKALIAGEGAADFVNTCLANDLDKIGAGQAQYTFCLDPSGGVVDDLIQYRVSDDEIFLIPNAANTAEVVRRLEADAAERAPQLEITDEHTSRAVFAVQGPKSAEILEALGLPTELDYMHFRDAEFEGSPVRVCRTGYTGEYGFELLPLWDAAAALWRALEEKVLAAGGALAGLGARDSLRLEAGYPLHGHELTLDSNPVQARGSWAIGFDKPAFWGREAVVAEKENGPSRRLYALKVTGRGVLRAEQDVLSDGEKIGITSSGTFSPTLGTGIALAFVDVASGVKKGDTVAVDVRGRQVECELHLPGLVANHTR